MKDGPQKYCDTEHFMEDVMNGTITDDDCYWDGPGNVIIDMILNYARIKDLPGLE